MRKFAFDLSYTADDSTGSVAERFRENDISSTGMGGCLGGGRFWRVERVEAAASLLDTLEDDLLSDPIELDRVSEGDCEHDVTVDRLGRTDANLEYYFRVERLDGCETIYTLAAKHIGSDVLFEFEREGNVESWRILMESDDRVGILYDAIQASLRPSIQFDFDHIGDASSWRTDLVSQLDMPAEQLSALELAVERGYYETPREVTLDELAATLEWPRSTLSYRLRRAESRLVKAFSASGIDDAFESFQQAPNEVTDE
ncbi:hypothetical protein JCM17823_06730 [Halorubrum gandharaense]